MIEYKQTRNQKQDCALIHILFYSNLDYPFPNVDLEMKITQNIINDLKYFEQVFSIEQILMSIKSLKEQVKSLESKQLYQIATPSPI